MTEFVWHKVSDKLPEYDEYVLWHTEAGHYFVEARDKDGDIFDLGQVTHWAKICGPYYWLEKMVEEHQKMGLYDD